MALLVKITKLLDRAAVEEVGGRRRLNRLVRIEAIVYRHD